MSYPKLKKIRMAASAIKTKQSQSKSNVELPTEKSVPVDYLGGYTLMIYGREKIGKTSLASNFPDTFCSMFEPGGASLRIYQKPINSWNDFLGYIDLLSNSKHNFKTVVIDTGKIAYESCLDYICEEEGITHPSDESYGKGWEKVRRELSAAITKLINSGLGIIIICHEKIGDITRSTNEVYNRIHPDLSKQAYTFFSAVIDTIGYYRYVGDSRILQIVGNEDITAGTRCEENFLTVTGERIEAIPMGSSSEEAYKNLVNAFLNKQKTNGRSLLTRFSNSGSGIKIKVKK